MDIRGDSHQRRTQKALLVLGAISLVISACTSTGPAGQQQASAETRQDRSATIEQPAVGDLQVAPDEDRVDLAVPTFSDPTRITNPLFPVSSQRSVLLLGRVDGLSFRTEVTLLPDPRIIEWEGQQVATLVSQYVAFLGGRIEEVAYDMYAQDDEGNVWYFGEDVFNFSDGAITDTHGTWIAGKDGPAAMIMPADPQVGDVYRPENIPGFVFEEVTVKAVNETIEGHLGPIDGAVVVEELHMDGAIEAKTFAPGYGEYYTSGGGDVEALDLAVPTDALSGPLPEELETLENGSKQLIDDVGSGDWGAASGTVERMVAAWERYPANEVPQRVGVRMAAALSELQGSVRSRSELRSRQASIETARSTLDLGLRYRSQPEVDLARFDLWLAQLILDAARGDQADVNGDFFTLDYIRDRFFHALEERDATFLNSGLESLLNSIGENELDEAARVAGRIRGTVQAIDL